MGSVQSYQGIGHTLSHTLGRRTNRNNRQTYDQENNRQTPARQSHNNGETREDINLEQQQNVLQLYEMHKNQFDMLKNNITLSYEPSIYDPIKCGEITYYELQYIMLIRSIRYPLLVNDLEMAYQAQLCSPNIQTDQKDTNLLYLIVMNTKFTEQNINIVKLLLKYGYNPNLAKPLLNRLIKYQYSHHLTIFELLLDAGMDPNILLNNCYILSQVVFENAESNCTDRKYYYDLIKLLLERGADPNLYNSGYFTALMTATGVICLDKNRIPKYKIKYIDHAIINLLLSYGADPEMVINGCKSSLKIINKVIVGNTEISYVV
jgi:hypothetical protein